MRTVFAHFPDPLIGATAMSRVFVRFVRSPHRPCRSSSIQPVLDPRSGFAGRKSPGSVAVLGHDFSRLDIDNALDCSLGFPLGAPESLRRPSARGDKPLSELW
jgi:hypothetical protein